jgi:hypothetical protein
MPFPVVTDHSAVLAAISEYDRLGAEAFRKEHGFGKARGYFLDHEGTLYDSKAILGVAFSYQFAGRSVGSAEFSGGIPVADALEGLGFSVTRPVPWSVVEVELERNTVLESEVTPTAGTRVARRDEAALVESFAAHLRAEGHEVKRHRIRVLDGEGRLATDLFDRTENILYEAKSRVDRATIRLGLGQILDYKRFLTDVAKYRLLLPSRPIDELVGLLARYDIGVTWNDEGAWRDAAPADFVAFEALEEEA